MININGTLQIVPGSVAVDTGTINMPDESGEDVGEQQPAIILGLGTSSGTVAVIIPADNGLEIGKGIMEASQKAKAESKGIQVVKSLNEADRIAEAKNQIDSQFKR